jgi:hypothetical protein
MRKKPRGDDAAELREHRQFAAGQKAGEATGKADARADVPRSSSPRKADPVDPFYARGWVEGYDKGYSAVLSKLAKAKGGGEDEDGKADDETETEPDIDESYPVPSAKFEYAVLRVGTILAADFALASKSSLLAIPLPEFDNEAAMIAQPSATGLCALPSLHNSGIAR